MSQYLEALRQAMVIYPMIVVLFTVPYIAWSYHKYGSVLSLRVLIVYSFLLYLLCVYCLVILPLPTPEKAATLHGHKAQLIPFSFLADIVKQAEIQPGQPASWLHIFTGSAFWTTIFNLFMTMPFGVYLRYYFCYHWRKTLRLSFLLSLFFELTQLSGLYFVYPGSYRLFDVDDLIVNTNAGYAVYDFNKVYHAVYNFCVVAMSNFYLDVTKDRLYCTNGAARKAAQTTMYKILVALDKIIAPILCFTSQEIWDFMPKTEGMNKYVVFEAMPKAGQYAADDAFKAKWAQLIAVRDEVKKVLEQARAEKTIGASLEASVTLYCNDAVYDLLNSIPMDELADLMIVSHVELVKGEGGAASAVEGLGVAAAHATGDKCERCWKYSASIGSHPAHPTLCARCASVVEA